MMALILTLLEGSSVFAVAAAALLIFVHPVVDGWRSLPMVLAGAGGLALSCVLAFSYAGFYDRRVIRSFEAFLGCVPRAIVAAISLTVLASLPIPAAKILEDPFKSCVLLAIGTIFGPVFLLRVAAYRLMRGRRFVQRLLIIGASRMGWRLVHEIEAARDYRYSVAAIVDDASDTTDAPLVMGPLDCLKEIVEDVRPDRIVLAMADWRGRVPVHELLKARVYQGIPIQNSVEVYERLTGKLAIEALTPSHLIFSEGFCQSRLSQAVRRCVSVLVATVGLVVTAPLAALIALAITVDSSGPVLFTQRRLGLHGKPFVLFKFRTMRPTTSPTSEWERDNRDRVTRVGKWLRRLWLDELPQLVNVLRGDMDLVGPRPHPVSNAGLFAGHVPYYDLRMAVRPGITGWAQVRLGYANGLDEETEKIRYDLYYIKHRSIWLDLRILFETLKMILGGRSADASDAHQAEVPQPPLMRRQLPVRLTLNGDGGIGGEAGIDAGQLNFQSTRGPGPR